MKIAVLTSGGVDSSVALALLAKEKKHKLTAFYLKIWLEDELKYLGNCPWEEDLEYVKEICEKFDVPLKIVPLQKEYWNKVVKYTVNEVKKGRTPNPDMMCNSQIKFGEFIKKYGKGFDRVATGHYAQVMQKSGKYYLKTTSDPIKDQTYFLAYLKQNQLKKVMFPIGDLDKGKVRKLAHKFNLPNKDRKDSQGICFLGKIRYGEFLRHHLGVKKGKLINYDTKEYLGEHDGFWYYTIGQRKGIKLSGGPYYVVKKDTKKNIIYVSNKYHDAEKKRNEFIVNDFNWFDGKFPKETNLSVKLRHGPKIYKCTLKKKNKDSAVVKIKGNDQGIAAGQFAVFYKGKICLGCGIMGND
ncbi:MAG: tRNA 2-thiouridine(34) synthase MnmA [Candidatus Gracilibacteria bacterium]|jgi:tRNA-specific 2-thiouridylase